MQTKSIYWQGPANENDVVYKIFHNDKVNSILSAALRNLNPEQLVALKDCLVSRTPAAPEALVKEDVYRWVMASHRLPADGSFVVYRNWNGTVSEIWYQSLGAFYPHSTQVRHECRIDGVKEWLEQVPASPNVKKL